MTEKRQCACRKWIEAEPDSVSVFHAVRVHQETPEHRSYAMAQAEADERRSVPVPSLMLVRRVA